MSLRCFAGWAAEQRVEALARTDTDDTIQLEDIASPKVREEIAAIEAAAVVTAPTPPRRSTRNK